MDRIILRAAISIICAAGIGFLQAYETEIGIGLCILMPTLCFVQKRRIHAFLVAFAYHGTASSILIPGIVSFFGHGSTLQLAFALWGTACLLLALPFVALWSSDSRSARWRAPLAVLASVPPPLGIIGWANPLTSAGILFPRNEATDLFWQPTLTRLSHEGKVVLIGAGIDIPSTDAYRNAVIIRGAETGALLQRIPVPVGMWNPLRKNGVPLSLTDAGVKKIAGTRVAALVCYEQFLTWPVLVSATSDIDLVIGVANDYWSKATRIPIAQRVVLATWGRLFSVP